MTDTPDPRRPIPGLSVRDLTAEAFAAIGNAGFSTRDVEQTARAWPELLARVQPSPLTGNRKARCDGDG